MTARATFRPLLACAAALLAGASAPAFAANDAIPDTAALRAGAAQNPAPGILSLDQRIAYSAIFNAIRSERWADAANAIAQLPQDGILVPVAKAELYLAARSPRVERPDLIALLQQAPDLPQAVQLTLLARKRGATDADLPALPVAHDLDWSAGAPRRVAARTIDGAAADALAQQARPLLKSDQPAQAEALLAASQTQLTPEALTEWQQRVAWSYYLNDDDTDAIRLASQAAHGAGEWSVQASWVMGLASWRRQDCRAAEAAFGRVASNAGDEEMRAAGLFWKARADMACGRFDKVQPALRAAARIPESFYGLIAARLLGIETPVSPAMPSLTPAEWTRISARIDVRRAAALAEIGEYGLADEMLRWQAKIGPEADHKALLHLAARLNLPATQLWLAHTIPQGETVEPSARYPQPDWVPQGGWQVDKALVFAHAMVESRFRTDAVSPAGARGLMQVLPTTADLIERRRGGASADRAALSSPAVNMAYGQAYLEQLAQAAGTGGLLPKVIAAYNAGPGNVVKWNATTRAADDPLLYIESIPYAETRAYVTQVLRDYWMYQHQSGEKTVSLKAMAQNAWPRFPKIDANARAGAAATAAMTLRSGEATN